MTNNPSELDALLQDIVNPEGDEGFDSFPPDQVNLTGNARTEARLCAVQAVYQMLLLTRAEAEVLQEFANERLRRRDADKKLFSKVVSGVGTGKENLDAMIAAHLRGDWTMEKMGTVEHAILLCALSELMYQVETPVKVILNEYLTISGSYFGSDEVSFINAVLDNAARKIRPEAF